MTQAPGRSHRGMFVSQSHPGRRHQAGPNRSNRRPVKEAERVPKRTHAKRAHAAPLFTNLNPQQRHAKALRFEPLRGKAGCGDNGKAGCFVNCK